MKSLFKEMRREKIGWLLFFKYIGHDKTYYDDFYGLGCRCGGSSDKEITGEEMVKDRAEKFRAAGKRYGMVIERCGYVEIFAGENINV